MNSLVGIVSPKKFEGGSYGNTFIDWCTIKTKWLGMSLPRISEGRPIGIHHLVVEQLKQNIGICPLKKFERKVWWWYIHWLELNKNKIIGIISQEVWRGGPVDASFGCWAIRSKILVFAFSQDIWREGLMVIHSLVGAHKNNDWDNLPGSLKKFWSVSCIGFSASKTAFTGLTWWETVGLKITVTDCTTDLNRW